MTGAKDEHLPYPNDIQQPPLSKLDCAQTDEEKIRASKYPYRRVVGQLMYGMVHTMVSCMHSTCYAKWQIFRTHDGPKDIKIMTDLMQLRFQCDGDLGGNLDNEHSQKTYLGYLYVEYKYR